MNAPASTAILSKAHINYETRPELYQHWQLKVEGPVATLVMNINEDGGLREGYKIGRAHV